MEFKFPRLERQLKGAPPFLQNLAGYFDMLSRTWQGVDALITRVNEPAGINESGVHLAYRAIDFRDFYAGKWRYSQEIRERLVSHMNQSFPRSDGRPTLLHHKGTSPHFHLQISWNQNVYEGSLSMTQEYLLPLRGTEEMAGIKESKEAIDGALALALCVIKLGKDGFQISDVGSLIAKILSDPQLKQELDDALTGMKYIPAEMADLDLSEGIELAMHLGNKVPALLAALKSS